MILTLIQAASFQHPIKQAELCALTGLDAREVRREVERLRRAGWLICSSRDNRRGGYWLASTGGEFAAWSRTARAGAQSVFKTLSRMRRSAEAMDQPGLPGLEVR